MAGADPQQPKSESLNKSLHLSETNVGWTGKNIGKDLSRLHPVGLYAKRAAMPASRRPWLCPAASAPMLGAAIGADFKIRDEEQIDDVERFILLINDDRAPAG